MSYQGLRRWRNVAAVLPALALLSYVAAPAHAGNATRNTIRGSSILLCSAQSATAADMAAARKVVASRVHHGFGFRKASVRLSSSSCIAIVLPHDIRWLRWLADDVSGIGRFGFGVRVPDAKKSLPAGSAVRYIHDAVTSANKNLPVVRVIVARPGIKRRTVRLERRGRYDYAAMDFNKNGSKRFCKFTSSNIKGFAPVVLDRRVVSDPQILTAICGGSVLLGFPVARSLDHPLGPREVIADLHSGLLPIALRITSLQ